MIAYFDASAFLELVIDEPGSAEARETWHGAHTRISSRLLYPEARAGLARAHRMQRLGRPEQRAARREIESLLEEADFVEVTEDIAWRAGDLAETHALRAYDAVHLASAETIADDATVLVAADGDLLEAAHAYGVSTLALTR